MSEITDQVLEQFAGTPEPRLREIMLALTRHLHAFAAEVELTEEEWWAGVEFLTATGRITSGVRQEFVLLSDVLGLSSLVVGQTHDHDDLEHTDATLLGPFYVEQSPPRPLGDSITRTDDGEPVLFRGRIVDPGGAPLPGARIDVWQTASNRLYDVQDPGQEPGNMRGTFRTGADGRYRFRTVRPVSYPIPDDGPVGRLLAATGRHPWRAAHVHFKISADGHETLVTQIYDADNAYVGSDAVFGVRESLVRTFVPVTEPEWDGLLVEQDFVLARTPG